VWADVQIRSPRGAHSEFLTNFVFALPVPVETSVPHEEPAAMVSSDAPRNQALPMSSSLNFQRFSVSAVNASSSSTLLIIRSFTGAQLFAIGILPNLAYP
jgi:hypothetical protein